MAGNVSIETDAADNWKPSKKKSRERIDGIVALNMAWSHRRRTTTTETARQATRCIGRQYSDRLITMTAARNVTSTVWTQ